MPFAQERSPHWAREKKLELILAPPCKPKLPMTAWTIPSYGFPHRKFVHPSQSEAVYGSPWNKVGMGRRLGALASQPLPSSLLSSCEKNGSILSRNWGLPCSGVRLLFQSRIKLGKSCVLQEIFVLVKSDLKAAPQDLHIQLVPVMT